MTAEPPHARLSHAFAFSADDLAANRAGALTPSQQQRIARQAAIGSASSRLAVLAFVGSAAFFILGAPFLISDGTVPVQALPALGATALMLLGVVGLFVSIGLRRIRSLRQAQVSTATGVVRRTTRQFRHGRWTARYVWVGHVRFQVTTEQQYAAFVEGGTYRVYYIQYPPTQLILSVEPAP